VKFADRRKTEKLTVSNQSNGGMSKTSPHFYQSFDSKNTTKLDSKSEVKPIKPQKTTIIEP